MNHHHHHHHPSKSGKLNPLLSELFKDHPKPAINPSDIWNL
jgi:hypothetical protein